MFISSPGIKSLLLAMNARKLTIWTVASIVAIIILPGISKAQPDPTDECQGNCDRYNDRYCDKFIGVCQLCADECSDASCQIPKCADYFNQRGKVSKGIDTPTQPSRLSHSPSRVQTDESSYALYTIPVKRQNPPRDSSFRMQSGQSKADQLPSGRETASNEKYSATNGHDVTDVLIASSPVVIVFVVVSIVFARYRKRRAGDRNDQTNGKGQNSIVRQEEGHAGGPVALPEIQVFIPAET